MTLLTYRNSKKSTPKLCVTVTFDDEVYFHTLDTASTSSRQIINLLPITQGKEKYKHGRKLFTGQKYAVYVHSNR